MPEPLLTVVVCAHNRACDLERCLDGLAALEDEVDVIVIDSASTPPLSPLVQRFEEAVPRLSYQYEPLPGLARARNRGLELARSELVAFIDDDTVPEPEWARKLARPFGDVNVLCVGGSCRAAFESPRPRWLSDRLLQFAGVTRFGVEPRSVRSSAEYPFGANVCFRRSALLAIGGFRLQLGRVGKTLLSGEEQQAIEHLRRVGGVIWLEPHAIVDHRVSADRCRARYYWRRLWWQGISRARARRSPLLAARLLAAAPIRLVLWALTGDRFYLFRAAETAGYLSAYLRPRDVIR